MIKKLTDNRFKLYEFKKFSDQIMAHFSIQKLILVTLIFCSSALHSWALLQGREGSAHAQERADYVQNLYQVYSPFYTGPLLAPSAHTVPYQKVAVQPYFFWAKRYGGYNHNWSRTKTQSSMQYQFLNITQYGLTEFMELNVTNTAYVNRRQNQHYSGYGDTSVSLGFQMLNSVIGTPVPSCVLEVSTIFPTGKYENLEYRRLGTDAIGGGAYGVNFSLNLQKSFNSLFKRDLDPRKYHPIDLRWSFAYTINSRTRVKGINSYGGTERTHGIVKPGNTFTTIFAWQISFNKQWVFATDWEYTTTKASKFKGNNGGANVGNPTSQNFSVAPAIEFNLNSNVGFLGGVWFSLAGSNSGSFVTGIFSFTVMF